MNHINRNPSFKFHRPTIMMTALLPMFVGLAHKPESGNGFPYTVNLFQGIQGRPKRLLCKDIAIPTEHLFIFSHWISS